MTPDYRAMCEKLVELDDTVPHNRPGWIQEWTDAIADARALLAQSEPEGSAIMDYARQCNTQAVAALVALEVLADAADRFGPAGGADGKVLAAEVKKARGVLARAVLAEADGPAVPDGREPASVALQPSDGEVAELVVELRRICFDVAPCDADAITRAADLLEAHALPLPTPDATND